MNGQVAGAASQKPNAACTAKIDPIMQLPIKAHYATVAMLALAQSYEQDRLLTVRTIADEQTYRLSSSSKFCNSFAPPA